MPWLDAAGQAEGLSAFRFPSPGFNDKDVWLEFKPSSAPQPAHPLLLKVAAAGGSARLEPGRAQSFAPSSSTAHGDMLDGDRVLVKVRLGSSRLVRVGAGGSRVEVESLVAHGEPHGSSMLAREASHDGMRLKRAHWRAVHRDSTIIRREAWGLKRVRVVSVGVRSRYVVTWACRVQTK